MAQDLVVGGATFSGVPSIQLQNADGSAVPYIEKPTEAKTITENGTYDVTNVASAVVEVKEKPTQFTNVLTLDSTIKKIGYRVVTSGYSATNSAAAVVTPCNEGEHILHFRGWMRLNSNNGNVYACKNVSSDGHEGKVVLYLAGDVYEKLGTDEYGDTTLEVSIPSGYDHVGFCISTIYTSNDDGDETVEMALQHTIVTIDDPIGNGGYTG